MRPGQMLRANPCASVSPATRGNQNRKASGRSPGAGVRQLRRVLQFLGARPAIVLLYPQSRESLNVLRLPHRGCEDSCSDNRWYDGGRRPAALPAKRLLHGQWRCAVRPCPLREQPHRGQPKEAAREFQLRPHFHVAVRARLRPPLHAGLRSAFSRRQYAVIRLARRRELHEHLLIKLRAWTCSSSSVNSQSWARPERPASNSLYWLLLPWLSCASTTTSRA